MGIRPLTAICLTLALTALVSAGCAGSASAEAIDRCIDLGRERQMADRSVIPPNRDDCTALAELDLLCEDGRPSCGAAEDAAGRTAACNAINVHFLGGDIGRPLTCSDEESAGQLCANGWPSISPDEDPPDRCNGLPQE